MSVEYKSTLIFGYNLTSLAPKATDEFMAFVEQLEDYGFDVVYDPYNNDFIYAGAAISNTSLGDEAQVDVITAMLPAQEKVKDILKKVPLSICSKFPLWTVYYLCYAV